VLRIILLVRQFVSLVWSRTAWYGTLRNGRMRGLVLCVVLIKNRSPLFFFATSSAYGSGVLW